MDGALTGEPDAHCRRQPARLLAHRRHPPGSGTGVRDHH